MENIIPVNGVTSAEPKITDFTIGGGNVEVEISETALQDSVIVQADQSRERRYWYTCVPHATIACIADLFNLSNEEYLALVEEGVTRAVDAGKLDLNSGMAVSDMVDIARKMWNEKHPDKEVMSFRIPFADSNLVLALSRGHSIVTAYRGGPSWNEDFNADGILNKGRYSPITYGHSVRVRGTYGIVDNYLGKQAYNQYKVNMMKALVGPHFWDCFYIFLPVDKMTASQKTRLMAQKSGIWNGTHENDLATFSEIAIMIGRAYRMKNRMTLDPSNQSYVNDLVKGGIKVPADPATVYSRTDATNMVKAMFGYVKWSGSGDAKITRGELAEILQNTLTGVA